MRNLLCGMLCLVILFSCEKDNKIASSDNSRPLETWVFRSVLDQNPRMITAALDKNLFVSYFTQNGTLYKAWKGAVNFEGAVFDGAHGPQPTSVGDAYWVNDDQSTAWSLIQNGQKIESSFNYLGHRFKDGHCQLMFELVNSKNGKKATVIEQIELGSNGKGDPTFERKFSTENNTGASIHWTGEAPAAGTAQFIYPEGAEIVSQKQIAFENKTYELFGVSFNLDDNAEVVFSMPLNEPTIIDENIEDGFDINDSDLPEGATYIGKHDCKTCHNKVKKTIGPAYVSIAKKYPHNDESILMLANKIKKGGSGIWGEQVMTPHPEIPDFDLKSMVSYIFTLADYEGEESVEKSDLTLIKAATVDEANLVPGSITRAYNISSSLKKMPKQIEKKLKAVHAGVMPNFDNISGSDFQNLKEFLLASFFQ